MCPMANLKKREELGLGCKFCERIITFPVNQHVIRLIQFIIKFNDLCLAQKGAYSVQLGQSIKGHGTMLNLISKPNESKWAMPPIFLGPIKTRGCFQVKWQQCVDAPLKAFIRKGTKRPSLKNLSANYVSIFNVAHKKSKNNLLVPIKLCFWLRQPSIPFPLNTPPHDCRLCI